MNRIRSVVKSNNYGLSDSVIDDITQSIVEHNKEHNISIDEWIANQPKEELNELERWTRVNKRIDEPMPLITNGLRHLMHPKDVKRLDALPEQLFLFRAMSYREFRALYNHKRVTKQSWTLQSGVAKEFLTHGANSRGKVVVKVHINKSDILGFTNERNELECIVRMDTVVWNVAFIGIGSIASTYGMYAHK